MLPLVERIFFLFLLVIAGPVKAAYVPPGENQAIRNSFFVSESGSGCAFTRFFFRVKVTECHSPVDFEV